MEINQLLILNIAVYTMGIVLQITEGRRGKTKWEILSSNWENRFTKNVC